MIERANQNDRMSILTDEAMGMSTGFRLGRRRMEAPLITPGIRERGRGRIFFLALPLGAASGSGFFGRRARVVGVGANQLDVNPGEARCQPGKEDTLSTVGGYRLRAGGTRSRTSRPAEKSTYRAVRSAGHPDLTRLVTSFAVPVIESP